MSAFCIKYRTDHIGRFVIGIWLMWFCYNPTAEGVEECETFRSTTKNISVSINGSDANDCCQYGKCLCSSLDKALNCSGNNKEVTIFIYSDMVSLSTTADISNVNNFMLTSNGATINCNGDGGVVFTSISSLVINRITWNSCGNSPGAISVYNSLLVIKENNFKNSVTRAVAVYHSSVYIDSDVTLSLFSGNKGGALYISNSNLTLNGQFNFINNFAISGAAIYFTNQSALNLENGTQISFLANEAAKYGGAIYIDLATPCSIQHAIIQLAGNSSVTFTSNIAGTAGRSWYFELNTSCNFSRNISDPNSLLYYPSSFKYINSIFSREISTTLYQLKLLSPASCIKEPVHADENCNEYEISDIMLGQEILIPAQALSYYGTIARPTQVLIKCSDNDCNSKVLTGNNIVLVHNDTVVRGIEILRNQDNVSVKNNITLQLTAIGEETVSINLTVKLSLCFPGFEKVNVGGHIRCRCYQHKDVKCVNSSTAMIKFGYWFGEVEGQPTISYCPKQYCDFTSCDRIFGYCTLPRTQDGQCRHDRTGPSCGKCKPGYVLPFDSTKCIKTDQCSPGITFGVVLLNVVFWFVVTVTLMTVTCSKAFRRSFYANFFVIIYFYGVIEYLLEDTDDWPVFQFVTILSNLAKLNPKFLGTLCMASDTGWSGIDQQFFHYVHLFAISCILLTLSCLTRCCYSSHILRRISIFIPSSISVVLLLSHTSLSSTSIELLMPLTFSGTNASLYTYSSPDLKYFHGRHAFYGTVAGVFTVVFVIGFPVFLILEPYMYRRIDLGRMRPIIHDFRHVYKFKYGYFAGFYLVCRLTILGVFYGVQDIHNRLIAMLVICTVVTIIHGFFMPYIADNLNTFDLIILIIAIFAASFNGATSFTSFSPANDGIFLTIVIAPLLIVIFIILILNFKTCQVKRYQTVEDYYDELFYEDVDQPAMPNYSVDSGSLYGSIKPAIQNNTQFMSIGTTKLDDNNIDDDILNMSWR